MTQPAKQNTLQLPPANMPLVSRVVSTHPFDGSPTTWELGKEHPVIPKTKIVRMYIVSGECVEIYGVTDDGKVGVRNALPWHSIRMAEETMDPETFIDEIKTAENDDDPSSDTPAPPPVPNLPLPAQLNGPTS